MPTPVKNHEIDEVTKELRVTNKLGLNLRAASELVRTASNFKSQVVIKKDGFPSDGKSLIGLISLAIVYGSKLRVSIQGEDAREAWDAISSLARRNFGEKQ